MNSFPMGGALRHIRSRPLTRYGVALVLFLVALAARFMLVGMLPERGFPFLSFFPAVLLTAWLVGLWPGILVAMLSTFSAWAFFMGAPGALSDMARSDLIALIFFAGILVVDCIVIELMNSAMSQLRSTTGQLRRSQAELQARDLALREADRQKDVFLAMLAHELRNPLAPIRMAAELISASRPDDPKIGAAAGIIARQSAQLTRLVDDLLDVSRIQSSKLTLQRARIDLRQVVDAALETCQPLAQQAGHALVVTLPPDPVPVEVDAARLTQCVSNLLHNALKFTPHGGRIVLELACRDGVAALTVSDNGRGIASAMLPRLFDMFTQEHASGMHGNSGLGIGLALTRHLVEKHGGSVTASSAGEGSGACFELLLPLAAAEAAPGASAPDTGVDAARSAGALVLMVDDNLDSARMLQSLLEMEGFRVVAASSGTQALEAMRCQTPDVVLLDIGLPDMSGHEVARQAHAAGLAGDALLVALTGWSDERSRAASRAAGIAHHLNKPVPMPALLALIDAHMAGAAASGEPLLAASA